MTKKDKRTEIIERLDKTLDSLDEIASEAEKAQQEAEGAYASVVNTGKEAARRNLSLPACLHSFITSHMEVLARCPGSLYTIGGFHALACISTFLIERDKIEGNENEEIKKLAQAFSHANLNVH